MKSEQITYYPPDEDWSVFAHEDTFGRDIVQEYDVNVKNHLFSMRMLAEIQRVKEGLPPSRDLLGFLKQYSNLEDLYPLRLGPTENVLRTSASFENGREYSLLKSIDDQLTDLKDSDENHDQLILEIYRILPPFIKAQWDQYQKENPRKLNIIKWLSENPPSLMNVVQAHNYNMGKRQFDPDVRLSINEQKTIWAEGVKVGVKQGWLDNSVSERSKYLGKVNIFAGDYFSTLLQGLAGFYDPKTHEIVIAHNHWNWATVHELNHALLESWEEEMQPAFIREAITEHIAQTICKNNDIEELDVTEGTYKEERQILKEFILGAQSLGIDLRMADFTLAYSAQGKDKADRWREIDDKISAMIGQKNGLVWIRGKIDSLEKNKSFYPEYIGQSRHDLCVSIVHETVRQMIETRVNKVGIFSGLSFKKIMTLVK